MDLIDWLFKIRWVTATVIGAAFIEQLILLAYLSRDWRWSPSNKLFIWLNNKNKNKKYTNS